MIACASSPPVPAGTDILFALGLGAQVVGVSHECGVPADAEPLLRLTRGTVALDGLANAEVLGAEGTLSVFVLCIAFVKKRTNINS